MKEKGKKDRKKNAMKRKREKGEKGENEGRDKLENKDMRVYCTCRLRTAERRMLVDSILEDS
jgi:hypothetical protein